MTDHDLDDNEAALIERSKQKILQDDTLLSEEVIFPIDDGSQNIRKFINRKMLHDGNLKGSRNNNSILNTRKYVFRYPDGSEYTLAYSNMVE